MDGDPTGEEKLESPPSSTTAEFTVGEGFLDPAALDRLRALDRPGRPSVFAKVLTQYLATAEEGVTQLRESLRKGDATTLQTAAHRLKSSSAQLGASTMAALCQELESLGRAQTMEGVTILFARLEADYREVARRLRTELTPSTGDRT